jgi:hypothetical protein
MIPEMRFFDGFVRGEPDDCWHWRGSVDRSGYGYLTGGGRLSGKPASRQAYQLFVGSIPEGLVLDHLCHTLDPDCVGGAECLHRRCVNPLHLEPVTNGENVRRGWARGMPRRRPPREVPVPPPDPEPPSPYLKTREVALRLGVTTYDLADWRKRRIGPPWFPFSRNHILYRVADVEAYLRQLEPS